MLAFKSNANAVAHLLVSSALAFLASVTVVHSQSAEVADKDRAAPSGISQEYRLATGDRVTLTVANQLDLTGEYLVDGTGNLTIPLIGRVPVADSTLVEAEKKIVARLNDGYVRNPSITMRIAEFRPIYVVGDVKLPGSYPFRYGSTVLSAIAVAGGYGGAELVPGVAAADFLLADERVRLLEQARLGLIVREKRVAAQLEGKESFDLPDLSVASQQKGQIDELVKSERSVMAAQVAARDKEIDIQKSQKPTITAVIEALEIQTTSEKTQLSLVTEQFANYSKLDGLGLSRRVTTIALKREKAALESNIAKLGADRARLDLQIGEVDIKIQDLTLAYGRRALAEMQEVKTKLAEIDVTLPSARELRELRGQQAGGISTTDLTETPRTLLIMRSRNNVAETITATGETFLEPGDIVEIKRMRPRSLTGAARPQASAAGMGIASSITSEKN